jgi:hypothetical protein
MNGPVSVRFADPDAPDPLRSFAGLRHQGRPYNLWLTEQVLLPFLQTWDAEAALETPQRAFLEVLPAAAAIGDRAVLAVLSVTLNLQRTVAAMARSRRRPPGSPVESFVLSARWCGVLELGAPRPLGGLRGHRRRGSPDYNSVARVLRCSAAEAKDRCEDALAELRAALRAGEIL